MAIAGFESLDFHDFHRRELPRRLAAGNGALAAPAARGAGPLAFRIAGAGPADAYTYLPRAGGIDVVPGDADARTVVELSHESWEGVVHDLDTAPGLLYSGRVAIPRGDAMRFVRWEPSLRAMFHARPIFDPERAELCNPDGSRLDPGRSFRLGDDREEMAHFLRAAGFLLVKGVFSEDEVRALLGRAAEARAAARPGDRRSWWGKNRRGEEVLCRVTHLGGGPGLAELYRDRRVLELAGLADEKLVPRIGDDGEQGVTVLWKNPDMVEGLSDLPWHRDCGMGGHACMCPVLIFTLYLTPGTPEAGELRVLPGSWQSSYPFFEATDPRAPRGVGLAGEPGDVSLHYGDVMHAAPPPTGAGPYRSCVLLGFAREGARNHRGLESYNDVLLGRDDGQVEHLQRVADRVSGARPPGT